ncbi:MAG: ABC transporter permease subunit [Polyangiaceae bacterium]|nr:ABC transporter permease subunit [Polyangiaceae bacterium]
MRHAIGRILWLGPSLALVTVIAFVLLVAAQSGSAGLGTDVMAERHLRELPLFLNPSPEDVQSLSEKTVRLVAQDGPDAARATMTLQRLGGAALPHVLPKLVALSPEGRARVAQALMPIAHRMGLTGEEDVRGADGAILFWQRFWEDRGLDFRPAVVRRAVRRAALEASASRREELRELDTYALPELMESLGDVHTREDVARIARLSASLAPLSASCPVIAVDAPLEVARGEVARCRRWWSATGTDFVVLDGPSRIAAMVSETQYGKWLADAAWGGLGTTTEGTSVLTELDRRGRSTLLLVAAGMLGGYGAGALLGLLAGVRRQHLLGLLTTPLAIAIAATPPAVLSVFIVGTQEGSGNTIAAVVAMVLPGLALISRHERALTRAALREEPARTLVAFGAGTLGMARGHLRNSTTAALALLGSDLPVLLTVSFVVERAAGIDGLGAFTLAAVERRDLAWLMALGLVVSLTVGVAQILSDALLAALDPRLSAALSARGAGFE